MADDEEIVEILRWASEGDLPEKSSYNRLFNNLKKSLGITELKTVLKEVMDSMVYISRRFESEKYSEFPLILEEWRDQLRKLIKRLSEGETSIPPDDCHNCGLRSTCKDAKYNDKCVRWKPDSTPSDDGNQRSINIRNRWNRYNIEIEIIKDGTKEVIYFIDKDAGEKYKKRFFCTNREFLQKVYDFVFKDNERIYVRREDLQVSCPNPKCGSPEIKLEMNGNADVIWVSCKKCNMKFTFNLGGY